MSEQDPLLTNEIRREYRIVEPPYERSQNDEGSNSYAVTGPTESTRRHHVVLVLVLIVLTFERIGYFSLNNDLDLLILNTNFLEYRSVLILSIRAGGQFIFPLIGAWFGECLFGVHTTAVFGTVLEFIGSSLLLTSTFGNHNGTSGNGSDWLRMNWIVVQEPTSQYQRLVLAGLVLVMLGLSLTRPNYLMLAAVQIPEQKLIATGVIRWYLLAINVGAAVAIGGLGWTSMNVRAFSWPVCFFVSLVLLLVVRCASHDQLNQTNTKGFRKLLACFSRSRRVEDEQLSRLSKHIKIIFLFVGMQLPYFFLYATLDIPVVFGDVSHDWLVVWNLFEPVSIIIIILATFLTVPIIKRYFTNTNYLLKCITFGKLFITISCFLTILLDQFLYHLDMDNDPLYVGCYFPQFFMIGLSEVFCYMKALEFVYVETPKHLKNQTLGLFLTVIGLGYCTSLGFASLIRLPDFGSVVRQRIIELGIVGGFQLICIVPIIVFFRNYEYRKDNELSVSVAIDGSRREYIFGGDRFEDSVDSNNLFGGD